jgi:outer membrane protein assembly factor BamB
MLNSGNRLLDSAIRIVLIVVTFFVVMHLIGNRIRANRRAQIGQMMANGGASPGATFEIPKDSRLAWEFRSDNNAFSSIAVAPDGTIFAGAFNALFAIKPDGTLKWKKPMAGSLFVSTDGSNQLYIASSRGFMFGLSGDGTINFDPGLGVTELDAPPAIGASENVLFVNFVGDIWNFRPPISNRATWSHSTFREGAISADYVLPGEAQMGQIPTKASPVIYDDETVILPRQRWLHLFNQDGTPVWINELTAGYLGPAALDEDGTIYVGDDRQALYAVNRHGDLKWKFVPDGSLVGSAVVGADHTVYFSTGSSMYALGPDSSVKWQVKPPASFTTGPILTADGTIYVGGPSGIFAYSADGASKWAMRSKSVNGALNLAGDGTIYFACGYYWVCAAHGEGSPLARSPWPKMYHDPSNSNRILTNY